MTDARFLRERPQRPGAPVDAEQSVDGLDPVLQICFAREEQAGDTPRGVGRQRRVIHVALVHHEGDDAFRFPGGELVVELSARGHAPEQQRRVRHFRMSRAARDG